MEHNFYEFGKADGKVARNSRWPAHKNWPKGPHFNSEYERGYWDGYNG